MNRMNIPPFRSVHRSLRGAAALAWLALAAAGCTDAFAGSEGEIADDMFRSGTTDTDLFCLDFDGKQIALKNSTSGDAVAIDGANDDLFAGGSTDESMFDVKCSTVSGTQYVSFYRIGTSDLFSASSQSSGGHIPIIVTDGQPDTDSLWEVTETSVDVYEFALQSGSTMYENSGDINVGATADEWTVAATLTERTSDFCTDYDAKTIELVSVADRKVITVAGAGYGLTAASSTGSDANRWVVDCGATSTEIQLWSLDTDGMIENTGTSLDADPNNTTSSTSTQFEAFLSDNDKWVLDSKSGQGRASEDAAGDVDLQLPNFDDTQRWTVDAI